PVERARAADQGGEHHVAGEHEADRLQRHDAEQHRVHHAGQAAERAADDEGEQLEARHVVADRLGAQLVLADRLQDLAQRRFDDAAHEVKTEQEQARDEGVVDQRILEIQAQEFGPRDAGHAVLAAGHRGPLVGDEVEQLVQREREHDEVEARALHAEVAHQQRRERAHADADAEREEHVDAVVLEQPAGDVRRRAEEGRLAEGEQPGVAEQQVQPQAEDGEDPDLRRDRRPHDERQQANRNQDEDEGSHRMPNIPCGRISSTSAITAKITAVDASVQYAATTACATPISNPAAMAPSRLPSPPSATTTNAMPSMSTPMPGDSPRIGAVSAPAMPARNAPRAKATVKSLWMSMPSSETISLFSMPARMIAPYLVLSKNSQVSRTSRPAITITNRRYFG